MTVETTLEAYVLDKARRAKQAAAELCAIGAVDKNTALKYMAEELWAKRATILAANTLDVALADREDNAGHRIDRLMLDEKRIEGMVNGLYDVSVLSDPVGEVLEDRTLPNGLNVQKCRVPIGVLAIIYESRPNVTVDAAGLCLKTGNSVILRGGRESLRTNEAIVKVLHGGLRKSHVPENAIQFIKRPDHEGVDILIRARGLVDLVIPRGGAGLIKRVVEGAQVPVIETGVGNCHIYVDQEADLNKALAIVLNAKTQRPSVCNAAETLLLHQNFANHYLPVILQALAEHGVEVHGCERTLSAAQSGNSVNTVPRVLPATEADWETEFLAPVLAVKIVSNLEEAISHIAQYGTKHSEAIVTENVQTAERFLKNIDAAVVYHNASTRFTDGFEFGFGAEIGISTQKLHARGPMGLSELTSYQYRVRGNGQVRA